MFPVFDLHIMFLTQKRSLIIGIVLLVYSSVVAFVFVQGIIPFNLLNFLLVPIGIIIATLAVSSGIAGASFWFPVYLVMNIDARLAMWIALCTMFFGFGSGIIQHMQQKTINWGFVWRAIIVTFPAACIGSAISAFVPIQMLMAGFGVFVLITGISMLVFPHHITERPLQNFPYVMGFIGGFLKGLLSVGLEIMIPQSLRQTRYHYKSVIGSLVIVLFLTNLIVIATRIVFDVSLQNTLILEWKRILQYMIFIIPSVIIGGQIGPRIIINMSHKKTVVYNGILLIALSIFVFLNYK